MVQRNGEDAPPGIPAQYQSMLEPSLSEAEQQTLNKASGGVGLVHLIERRDWYRRRVTAGPRPVRPGGIGSALRGGPRFPRPENPATWAKARRNHPRYIAEERRLTAHIDRQLAELGVPDERSLSLLIEERFPDMFLEEAKRVAIGMLDQNERQAESERERYSVDMCTPDTEGLLEADRHLGELYPVRSPGAAVRGRPPPRPGGFLAALGGGPRFPRVENPATMMQAIQQERLFEERVELYEATRAGYGRRYPILLHDGYRPGSFARAPREELKRLVGKPIDDILANIQRVREAVNDDEMKVWQMNHVLAITIERLGVDHPVLRRAIRQHISGIQRDERFLSWVNVALAITSSLVAGFLLTPAAGAAVAAAWGTASLVKSISEYRLELAAQRTALDPEIADISANEPSLMPVLLDALFLGLDLVVVGRALRPAMRALVASPDELALAVFRQQARAELGEEAGERLARRVAGRYGIALRGAQGAEEQLARAREALAGFDLGDDAIARILRKGSDVSNVKGQLFEELMNADVVRRLAAGDAALGLSGDASAQLFRGDRIRDLYGQQLTDGLLAVRQSDGSLRILAVLEAKSGRSVAKYLRSSESGVDDAAEFARFVIEDAPTQVAGVLRRAGLSEDAAAVARGQRTVSEEAVKAIVANRELRRRAIQTETGGQIRKDVERLYPNVDQGPTSILVDGVPTPIHFSPTRTRFLGVLPDDVPSDKITRALRDQDLNFESLHVGGKAADLTRAAKRLIASQTPATAAP